MSTGRVINRPSDSPTDTTSAMRLRDDLAATGSTGATRRTASPGSAMIDTTLTSRHRPDPCGHATRRSRAPTPGRPVRLSATALAATIDQIRESLLADANTTYLGRPVFGGVTAGAEAYDATGAYVGTTRAVNRTVADGVTIRVDVDATAVFGAAGDAVFDHLAALSTALRAGDQAGIRRGSPH